MTLLTVNVKKKHIRRGMRCVEHQCPIALAIKDRLKGSRVFVSGDYITVNNVDIETPSHILKKICIFDEDGEMDPFTFELDLGD